MGKKVWFPFIPLLTAVMILGLNGCTQINESENAIPDTSFRVEDEAMDIQQIYSRIQKLRIQVSMNCMPEMLLLYRLG